MKDLKIFLQNVRKNNFLINTILEVNQSFDIIFIQEPSWTTLKTIPNHLNWLTFAREPCLSNNSPRVIIYINVRLSSFYLSLQRDIINHKDILLASFFNDNVIFWIINIYSNLSHSALKYLKDTEVNITNLLIMTGDFNIRDSIWDLSFPHHSAISDNLMILADSYNLDLSIPTHWVPTRYSDMTGEVNSVIGLMFLWSGSTELNNHSIHPDWRLSLDHAPFTITIPIAEENIVSSNFSIAKNNEEEESFINDVSYAIKNINVNDFSDSNNTSAPRPDKLSWSHLKIILKDDECLGIIIYITNVSYTSPPVRKQRSRSETTSEPYKPTFHSGHLSRNTSHSGAATLRIFHLPWQRYSYSTQSSMTELLLSVS